MKQGSPVRAASVSDRSQWSLEQWFRAAESYESYLGRVIKNRDLWQAIDERVSLPDDLPPAEDVEHCARFLALSEDWCGDAVNTLPVAARLADHYGIELRVLERDTNLGLMDRYLTDGRSRSIPVVIALDGDFNELGWWGPRPAELQTWVLGDGSKIPNPERYREARRWYAQDQGRSTSHEILAFLGRGKQE